MASIASPLLSPPIELRVRVQIYTYLLTSAHPLTIYIDSPPYRVPVDVHVAILSTCRTIYTEAQWLFFNLNTFRIDIRGAAVGRSVNWPSESYLPLFIQNVPEDNKRPDHFERYENLNTNVVKRGAVIQDTLRRMKHLEVMTRHDFEYLKLMIANCFSLEGQLLLEILKVLGDDANAARVGEKGGRRKCLSIRMEQSRLEIRIGKCRAQEGSSGKLPGIGKRQDEWTEKVERAPQGVFQKRDFQLSFQEIAAKNQGELRSLLRNGTL